MRAAIAPRGFERPLLEELGQNYLEHTDRLFLFEGEHTPVWAQNVWLNAERFSFKSISEAAKKLRSIQRNWWLHSTHAHRRAKLIAEQLPPLKAKQWPFPSPLPPLNLGSWTLLDDQTLLYSAECTSPYPDGELNFSENREDPPSRAYLKLWEAFTLLQKVPRPGEKVLDLGSSPGGWTWVLDQLGADVLSVDKAPLSPDVKFSKRVRYLEESAFALEPAAVGTFDWLFSDVICYPERLLEMVKRWHQADAARNFVCTLKYQAPTNHEIAAEFLKIPGSEIRHLTCNKHELTWTLLRPHDKV